ncbi:unnamed protein product [Ambrosiozyma monospora]|uniref:Unnamed protein product n=1 Tax=Ambrosiozyma monospora TaxID=43982 RepID=A0ACB5T137_AMBMO|nr:unnamed protein product [Ambrosiozyma monospora]
MFARSLRSSLVRTPLLRHTMPTIVPTRHFSIEPLLDVVSVGSDVLQFLHAQSGLPWWAFIPLATISVRSVFTLPFAIIQRLKLRKQNEIRPITNAMAPIFNLKLASNAQLEQLQRKTQQSATHFKTQTEQLTADKIVLVSQKEAAKQRKKLFKEYGCQSWKMAILPAIQIPLWVSMSYNFRLLTGWSTFAHKPIDMSLTTEGLGYLHDLTLSDPYYVLPITLGCIALTNAEWNFKSADLMYLTSRGIKNTSRPTFFDVVMNLSRASIVFLMVMGTQAPAAMVLYWISSNAFSLGQNLLLDRYLPLKYTPYSRFSHSAGKIAKSAVPLVKF